MVNKIKIRVSKSNFSPSEIETLYKEVLLYFENDSTDFKGYNLNHNPFLKKLQEELDFELITDMGKAGDSALDKFYFTDCKKKKIKSFFFHLRNAFAHNRIFKEKDGEIKLQDINGNELTFCATVLSFEKLNNIIKRIKEHENKA